MRQHTAADYHCSAIGDMLVACSLVVAMFVHEPDFQF
jgi:hypothetical protein